MRAAWRVAARDHPNPMNAQVKSDVLPASCSGSDPSQGNPAAFDKVTGLAQTAATLPASAEQTDSQVHRGRVGRGDYKEYPECTSVPQAEHQPPLAPLHHSSVSVSSTVSTSASVMSVVVVVKAPVLLVLRFQDAGTTQI